MAFYSVNVCSHCRKHLSISDDNLGLRKCAECVHLELNGVYTIEQYNNYLKKIKSNGGVK